MFSPRSSGLDWVVRPEDATQSPKRTNKFPAIKSMHAAQSLRHDAQSSLIVTRVATAMKRPTTSTAAGSSTRTCSATNRQVLMSCHTCHLLQAADVYSPVADA